MTTGRPAKIRNLNDSASSIRLLSAAGDLLQATLTSCGAAVFSAQLELTASGTFILSKKEPGFGCFFNAESILGFAADTLTPDEFFSKVYPGDLPALRAQITRAVKNLQARGDCEYRLVWPDGSLHWIFTRYSIVRDAEGLLLINGSSLDITQSKIIQSSITTTYEAVQSAQEQLHGALEAAGIGVFRQHLGDKKDDALFDHHVAMWNFNNGPLYGLPRDVTMTPADMMERIHPDDLPMVGARTEAAIKGDAIDLSIEYRTCWDDGSIHWLLSKSKIDRDTNGLPRFFSGALIDITARKDAEDRIQYLATHDALTGLPNRVMFRGLLNHTIDTAKRNGHSFAVMFIDLDRFKSINDALGHQAGDVLLQEISSRLKNCLRECDVVARLGGDEFIVLVPEAADKLQAAVVARKLIAETLRPVTIYGQECRVTASVGISIYPDDADDEETLMKHADTAMYFAKQEGKNNHQFYDKNSQSESLEKIALENFLRVALENSELSLNYQAKLDLKTDRINGVEALLRWQNPALGPISPARFIPIAEETGLIVPIGRWVLQQACLQNVAWQRQGLPPVSIAVNISPRQFFDESLLAHISDALLESGMAPELLEIEITESMVMHNTGRAIALLHAIKAAGVRIAIDDFGTGYSSLAQLKSFPVDTLKVDRSFIREVVDNADDRAITEAIIAMGKSLSLTIVAEGVETLEQQSFLRNQSCDEMQGFYFSKPVAPEEFAALLERHVAVPMAKTA